MASSVGYGRLITESMRLASRLKSFWVLGAFVLYLGAGYVVALYNNVSFFTEDLDLSNALLFGLLLPGLSVVLFVLHAAADGGLITTCVSAATQGQALPLGPSWQRGRSASGGTLACWFILAVVLVGWAGLSFGIPFVIGAAVHPIVGVGFGIVGSALFLITYLFLVPLGMFAVRAFVVDGDGVVAAWKTGLALVRGDAARAAGVSITATLLALVLWSIEIIAVLVSQAIWMGARALFPTSVAIAATVLVLLPIYVGVRGWLGSTLSYYWTLSFLWARAEAEARADA